MPNEQFFKVLTIGLFLRSWDNLISKTKNTSEENNMKNNMDLNLKNLNGISGGAYTRPSVRPDGNNSGRMVRGPNNINTICGVRIYTNW